MNRKLSRRAFLRGAALVGAGAVASACAAPQTPAAPQVVTQIVKETAVVKETSVVEKVVTATPAPAKAVKKVVVRYMCPTWCPTADNRV